MNKYIVLAGFCVSAPLLFQASPLRAAGFYIQEQSVSGLGAAFSGSTTNLNDPSTVYFNPAGMTRLKGTQAQFGVHIIAPKSQLKDRGSTAPVSGFQINGTDGGNPYEPTPVPNGFITHQVNDHLWFGIGATAPFGLANEYDDDWFGRYDSIKTELKVIDVQPSVAYKFNDMFSLAGGLNIQHASAELTSAAFAGVTEGISSLEGNDHAIGYTAGLQFTPWDSTVLGATYHSGVSHELEGIASVKGTTVSNFSVNGQANLDLPDIVQIGASHKLSERLTFQGQATWFKWSNFEDIRTTTHDAIFLPVVSVTKSPGDQLSNIVQNYQDTWAFALGAEYLLDDEWTLRGGMQFDETPTVDEFRTSRTPDGDRTWLSGGATYAINEKLSLDMAGTYIWIDEETIDVTRNNSFSNTVATQVHADTEGNVAIVALGLTYKF